MTAALCEGAPVAVEASAPLAPSGGSLRDVMETCAHRWITTLDGRRDLCLRCPETRRREAVLR